MKSDPLERLRKLVEEDWREDDGDRVSVVINQPPAIAPKPSLFPMVPAKLKPMVAIAVVVGAALVGAAATVVEWFR